MIYKCVCKDDFCDKKYGIGMRVFNETKSGGGRCSTCGREDVSAVTSKKDDKKKTPTTTAKVEISIKKSNNKGDKK